MAIDRIFDEKDVGNARDSAELTAEQANPHELLYKKIEVEMEAFRKSYDNMSAVQIYNDWYIIGFYESYSEMLSCDYLDYQGVEEELAWLSEMETPLRYLYDAWMDTDGAGSLDWDHMLDFVKTLYLEEKNVGLPSIESQIENAEKKSAGSLKEGAEREQAGECR